MGGPWFKQPDDEENPSSVVLQGLEVFRKKEAPPAPPSTEAEVDSEPVHAVELGDFADVWPVPEGAAGALVLVIDDSESRRQQLSWVLGKHYRVETASGGAAGLAAASKQPPDLILANAKLPGMSGYELCTAIKSDPGPLSRTPVILLSQKADLAKKIAALDSGADDYLIKPVHVEELRTRVRNLVKIHRQEIELLAALRSLEERDSVITQDLMQARELQQSMLPTTPKIAGLSIEAIYQPAELVGGDLYDFCLMADGVLRVFLADAPGHGLRASLTTMFIKSEYETAKRESMTPGAVLSALNRKFAGPFGNLGLHFTAICMDIDLARRTLTWSSAAHPSPCFLREGKARELAGGGTFVGVVEGVEYEEERQPFVPGDAVYLFTDGVTDQPNGAGEPFGEARLLSVLEEARARGRSAGGVLLYKLGLWGGPVSAYDDCTFLGVRFLSEEGS